MALAKQVHTPFPAKKTKQTPGALEEKAQQVTRVALVRTGRSLSLLGELQRETLPRRFAGRLSAEGKAFSFCATASPSPPPPFFLCTRCDFSWNVALGSLQSSGKLEKAEILEMTVQYLRALHSADFPRGREKGRRALGGGRRCVPALGSQQASRAASAERDAGGFGGKLAERLRSTGC